jgi:hypothetical protein
MKYRCALLMYARRGKRRKLIAERDRKVIRLRNQIINGFRDPRPNMIDVVRAIDDLADMAREGSPDRTQMKGEPHVWS